MLYPASLILLRLIVKCTVTDTHFTIYASCAKWRLSTWISFLTGVTSNLGTARTAPLLMRLAAVRIPEVATLLCSCCMHKP